MEEPKVGRVYKVLLDASREMDLHRVDAAFEVLDDLRTLSLGEWGKSILRGYEQLRHAKCLAEEAEGLARRGRRETAREQWTLAIRTCNAARSDMRAVAWPSGRKDDWPDIVSSFEEYLGARKRTSDRHSLTVENPAPL